jgi:hypothetical protein
MDLRKETLEKFLLAGELYDAMNNEQKEILTPCVRHVAHIQKIISEAACKINASFYCSECDGGCCTNGIEFGNDIPDYIYTMFYVSLEERKKIMDVVNASNGNGACSLKGQRGCALPIVTRPIHCKLFYCAVIPGSKKIMDDFRDPLKKADLQFRCALDEMNLRF